MRLVAGSILIGIAAAYFGIRQAIPATDIYPVPIWAGFLGIAGVVILFSDLFARIDRRLNKRPPPPYCLIDRTHGCCLELAADGSYESCLEFLAETGTLFNAEYSEHLETGPYPNSDKDKGYWNVKMFGQEFLVMRHRGYGLCIWGPEPPGDVSGFLRVAKHFGAIEFLTWQQRIARALRLDSGHGAVTIGE